MKQQNRPNTEQHEPRAPWQQASIQTILKLESVWALAPSLTKSQQVKLWELAVRIAGRTLRNGATPTEDWGAIINALRISVAALSKTDPHTLSF